MYQAQRTARTETVLIRQIPYAVMVWGAPDATRPPRVLLHGWMDVAASWQFVVDAFASGDWVLAPDWRGFGGTPGAAAGAPCDTFWFPDYLADLDGLIDHYAPGQPVDLIGHSMGGNIAMAYGGVRPQRVRRLVNLEGFGLPATDPDDAPKRYAAWIDELARLARGEMVLKGYPDAAGVARRLMKTNPRLPDDKAQWLARQWARPLDQPDGSVQWQIRGDAAHKVGSAQLYRADEALALYRAIAAPVLAVEADGDSLSQWWAGRYTLEQFHARLQAVRDCRKAVVRNAGHMLHHDQPDAVAALIDDFLR